LTWPRGVRGAFCYDLLLSVRPALACHAQEAQWENARQEADGAIGQEKAGEVLHRHVGNSQKTKASTGRCRAGLPHRARSGAARPNIGIRARPAPRSQLACCNTLTPVNSGFAFRLRRTVPRYGDTPQPSRDNVLLDTIHSTSYPQRKKRRPMVAEADRKREYMMAMSSLNHGGAKPKH